LEHHFPEFDQLAARNVSNCLWPPGTWILQPPNDLEIQLRPSRGRRHLLHDPRQILGYIPASEPYQASMLK